MGCTYTVTCFMIFEDFIFNKKKRKMLTVELECDYRDGHTPLYKKLCLQIYGM